MKSPSAGTRDLLRRLPVVTGLHFPVEADDHPSLAAGISRLLSASRPPDPSSGNDAGHLQKHLGFERSVDQASSIRSLQIDPSLRTLH